VERSSSRTGVAAELVAAAKAGQLDDLTGAA
jgi:hypothetical protein